MVMKLTPSLEEATVHCIDMKCFLIGSSVMCFCHFTFDILDGLKCHRQFLDGLNLKDQNLKDKS